MRSGSPWLFPGLELGRTIGRVFVDADTDAVTVARQARFDLKPHSRLPAVSEQMLDRLAFVRQPYERT